MKVKRIRNTNASILDREGWRVLLSYKVPVAAISTDGSAYRTEENFSRTTNRHINEFLFGKVPEIRPQRFFDELLNSSYSDTFDEFLRWTDDHPSIWRFDASHFKRWPMKIDGVNIYVEAMTFPEGSLRFKAFENIDGRFIITDDYQEEVLHEVNKWLEGIKKGK